MLNQTSWQITNVNPKSRRWCFTWNNYPENFRETLDDLYKKLEMMYICFEEEIAPSTGTPHIQGYFRCSKYVYKNTLTSFPLNWHIEVAQGNEEQNREYCSKDGKLEERGQYLGDLGKSVTGKLRKAQLEKKEYWDSFLQDIQQLPKEELEAKYPRECYMNAAKIEEWKLSHIKLINTWDGDLKDKNFWVWGPTGTGKSKWVHSQLTDTEYYCKSINKWWGGFVQGQHHIVNIEDFPRDGQYLAYYIKIWADRYSFIGEIKGKEMQICPGMFFLIITSNFSIEDCFADHEEDCKAIKRRFREIKVEDKNDIFLGMKLDRKIIGLGEDQI